MAVTCLADLVPDSANRRTHPVRNLEMVSESLRTVGAARSIVIDEGDVILAGNGVTEAAIATGLTKVRVIDAAGDELIAVRRSDLTPEQKRQLAMYDNRTAELATWDTSQLSTDLANGIDLQPYFFPNELQALGVVVPAFGPTDVEAQGRLDHKATVTCPHCGATFEPA